MIQLPTSPTSNINVLAESELEQVVGGYCHRRRYNHGKHCGGWSKRQYHCEKSYEAPPESNSSDGYESSDSYESTPTGGTQVVNVAVTVNIAQVQG